MGTMIDNKVSDLMIPSVDSAVQLHATILGTVNSNSNTFDSENIAVDEINSNFEKSDTFIHTSITFESVQSDSSSSTSVVNEEKVEKVVRTFKSANRFDEDIDEDKIISSSNKMNGLIDSDSDSGDNEHFSGYSEMESKNKPSIFDSDDSTTEVSDRKREAEVGSARKSKKLKKSRTNGENTSQQMTPKEAQIQRREIVSESQRRVRESRLSLPYHKPKQRTLKEFLSCRPKIAEPLPQDLKKLPAINAIKIVSNQPEELTKKLEEREKLVEKFYKSSSESENEQDDNPETEKALSENLVALEKVMLIDNLDTVDLEKTEIPDPLQLTVDETLPLENTTDLIIPDNPTKINESSQLETESSEEPSFTIHKILEEMNLDFSKLKNELIKSFLQPSRLVERSFEDQEDTELISQSDLNKIIDTLNTEDSGKSNENSGVSSGETASNKSIQSTQELPKLTDSQMSQLVSKYKSYSENNFTPASWQKDKNFEALSDSDTEDNKNLDLQNESGVNKTVLSGIKDFKPRLSGHPNEIIDLDEGVDKNKGGVDQLLQRFIQHTTKKASPATKVVEVSVVTAESGKVKEEKIALTVDKPKEEDSPLFEKPGAKLMRLREDLQKQIARHREEKWIKKQKETKELLGICDDDQEEEEELDEIYKDERDDCTIDPNNNDDGTEGDDEGEDDEEDEIDDEDDIKAKERKLPKSDFIDSEAEETDEESDEDENNTDTEEKTDENPTPKKKKVLRRIKTVVEDDSDLDNPESESKLNVSSGSDGSAKKSQSDLFQSQNKDGIDIDDIPLCQPNEISPETNRSKLKTQPDTSFLSPVQHLTALQGISSDLKLIQDSPKCTFTMTQEPSPLKGANYSPKQLFFDSQPMNTQDNLNELMELCSGKFVDFTQKLPSYTQDSEFVLSPTSQWASQDLKELKNNNEATIEKNPLEDESEILESDDDQVGKVNHTVSTRKNGGLVIVNTSDEDDGPEENQKNTIENRKHRKTVKKKRKKLEYSDDENSVEFSDEFQSGEASEDEESNDEKIIDYDSEENEIIVDKSKMSRPVDFIDVEAELSEDEHVGSADEDEDNLDEMEMEEGDADKIDHNKVKRQLEKIHMQQVLDQDKRDVRILQEILLEDGDLHSEKGRQKLFRWKNTTDDIGNDENVQPADDDGNADDIEEAEQEEKWRRMRHERETFLREQRAKSKLDDTSDIIDLENDDTSLLKLNHTSLRTSIGKTPPFKTSLSSASNSANKQVSLDDTIDIKKPLGLVNKKGSFLSRGERALSRLAAKTKPVDDIVIGGAKSSGNFVFQSVNNPLKTTNENENPTARNSVKTNNSVTVNSNGKRKNSDTDSTPLIFKKLRAAETLERRVSSRVKKLFDNL